MTFPRECDGGHMVRDRWREHTQVLPYNPLSGTLQPLPTVESQPARYGWGTVPPTVGR